MEETEAETEIVIGEVTDEEETETEIVVGGVAAEAQLTVIADDPAQG